MISLLLLSQLLLLVFLSSEVKLQLRLEYLSRAIMSAKSCNLRTAASGEGEFLHELEEKLEVARIQMQVYEALSRINTATPSRQIDQALAVLNSRLLDITMVSSSTFLSSGASIEQRAEGLAKFVRYTEVSLYRGCTVLGRRISFVIPRTSLYGGSLYRGSTVLG